MITSVGKTGLSFAPTLTGALLASMAASSRGQDAGNAKWQYEITPYLWAAGISGDIGLGPISTHTSASFSDILERLDFGAMGAFEARKDRWGVLFDGMYIKLSNSEDIARGRVRVKPLEEINLFYKIRIPIICYIVGRICRRAKKGNRRWSLQQRQQARSPFTWALHSPRCT